MRFMLAQMAMALVGTINPIVDSVVAGLCLTELAISVIRLQSVADLFVAVIWI